MIGRFPNRIFTRLDQSQTSARPAFRFPNISRALAILLAVIAAITLGAGFYLWRPAALFALIPYALFALCPVSMWLMMRSMNCSNDKTKGTK